MKQAYFAALDRTQAHHLPPAGSGQFQPISAHLQLVEKGEIRPCAASVGVSYEQLAALLPLVGYQPLSGASQANCAGSQSGSASSCVKAGSIRAHASAGEAAWPI